MDTTPASLLERLRRPAEAHAWAKFVELYTPFLFYWARRVGLPEQDAADLVQDVFALLVQKLPEFAYDEHKSFRSWLRTVTLNKWRENQRRRAATPLPVCADSVLEQITEPAGQDLWEAEYRQYVVGRALELMKSDFQPATWKACWEIVAVGRPAGEVAAELGMTVGAVYAAKFRVLGRLREELAGLVE
jgi:RNA polymerase sigma-70 factor, ECF subfamily